MNHPVHDGKVPPPRRNIVTTSYGVIVQTDRRTDTDKQRRPLPPDERQYTHCHCRLLNRTACVRCAGRVSPAKPLSPIRRSPLRYHVWTIAPRRSRIRSTPLEKKSTSSSSSFFCRRAHYDRPRTHTHTHIRGRIHKSCVRDSILKK